MNSSTKSDVKAVAVVVVGVLIAGFVMQQFRDVSAIETSRSGFGA